MHVWFIYLDRHSLIMVDMRFDLATLNSNNCVVCDHNIKCGYLFS